jgi:hypothetical protein
VNRKALTFSLLTILGLSVLSYSVTLTYLTDNQVFQQDDFAISSDSNYTTYLGGSDQEDATKIAFDHDGNVVLIGQTQSDDFPVTEGALQEDYANDWDSFVAKFSIAGDLLWATYLGGNSYEHVTGVNFDDENNIIVVGTTGGVGFPISPDAHQGVLAGNLDGFITKFAPNGTMLYSSYFGGTGEDWIYGLQFDSAGNYMFSGLTSSAGLGTTGVYQQTKDGSWDGFVAKVNAQTGATMMFSYVGGSGNDRAWFMTVDSGYNYLIGGMTTSTDLPASTGAFQETYAGATDAWLAKLSEDGSTLVFCSYLGGDDEDLCTGIDTDSEDNIFITGSTMSDDLSVVNAMNPSYLGGVYDSYISKWSPTGSVSWLSYFGGNQSDRIWDCMVDPNDDLVVVARTYSDDYPIVSAFQSERAGAYDACATRISSDGQTILTSSYLGGSLEDIGEGLAIDASGDVVISGRTYSNDFPATPGAYQEDKGGSTDVFICHTIFDPPDVATTTTTTTSTTSTTTTTTTTTTDGLTIDPMIFAAMGGVGIVIIVIIIIFKRKRS